MYNGRNRNHIKHIRKHTNKGTKVGKTMILETKPAKRNITKEESDNLNIFKYLHTNITPCLCYLCVKLDNDFVVRNCSCI